MGSFHDRYISHRLRLSFTQEFDPQDGCFGDVLNLWNASSIYGHYIPEFVPYSWALALTRSLANLNVTSTSLQGVGFFGYSILRCSEHLADN